LASNHLNKWRFSPVFQGRKTPVEGVRKSAIRKLVSGRLGAIESPVFGASRRALASPALTAGG
jgi:hypothetical protein